MLLSPGTTLGRYRIVDALRAGGMATLYLARRTGAAGFSKPVAIKVVHEHLSEDQRFIQMFVEEAKLAARVDDPHVAHTEELGHENNMYFIAMEYVLGGSLAQIIAALRKQARALHPSLAVRVTADAARGLHAVHEATSESGEPLLIVHRDVSPQNILLSTKGIVKIIDLGVAKAKGVRQSETGSLTGKLAYMSPEQALGEPIDRRTDVYALAIVLWEMLTSRRLFRAGSDLELLKYVQVPTIDPPSRWSTSAISPEIDAVIMRALSRDPRDRPQTAEAFCEELLAAAPDARRVATSELGGLVEKTLKEKLASERTLLRGGDGDSGERMISEPVVPDDILATRTIPLPEGADDIIGEGAPMMAQPLRGHEPTTGTMSATARQVTLVEGPKKRWPLAAAGAIVLLGIGIAVVFAPPRSKAPSQTPPSIVSNDPPAPTPEVSPTILEVVEAPLPTPARAPSAAPSAVAATPPVNRSKRRPHGTSPAPAPNGSTSIVHGTPLTTEVR